MKFMEIHLCGVHPGLSNMHLLLMRVHSSADAERRGRRESGPFSPRLPVHRGGSGSAKDKLQSVQEAEYGIRRTLGAGCLFSL